MKNIQVGEFTRLRIELANRLRFGERFPDFGLVLALNPDEDEVHVAGGQRLLSGGVNARRPLLVGTW